jgi:heme-degrading monooxygenase HmoA
VIARMWETRIREGQLDEFCTWTKSTAWPQFLSAPGFGGGELYRSDTQDRAVIVTRWASTEALAAGNEWFDLGAERFVAREPEAWEFTPVDLA